MSGVLGALGLNSTDSERVWVSQLGQAAVYDAINMTFAQHNMDLNSSAMLFLEGTTPNWKERYYLPGGGYMQRKRAQSRAGAVKATGSWDVAYPIEEFGAAWCADEEAYRNMTAAALNRTVMTVLEQDVASMRREILKAIFNNTARTFIDPLWGSLTIQPLANADGTVYPPLIGSDADATGLNNYLASGYAAASISDTNNPVKTIVDLLESYYGTPTGGSRIAVFCDSTTTPYIEALTDFVPVPNMFVNPGDDTATPQNLPPEIYSPGHTWRVIGTTASSGAIIAQWARMPAGYMLGIHLDAPKPLKRRVDAEHTGYPDGLHNVVQGYDVPFWLAEYRHRYGFGCGNRQNGVVMQLTTGSYTIPSGYS